MGRRCKTCDHPKRAEIEEDLLNNVTYRNIGTKYGFSHVSIRRHFEHGHIAKDLVRATEVKKIAYSENLLDKLLYLQHEALKILDEAKNPEEGKPPLLNTALSAIGKAAGMLETQAKLAGQIKEQEINILINPIWLSLKQEIFQALKPFPDAQAAVFAAVAGGVLSDVQKKMIKGEPEYKPLHPAIKELIDREFEEDPGQNIEQLPEIAYEKKKKAKPPQRKGLQPILILRRNWKERLSWRILLTMKAVTWSSGIPTRTGWVLLFQQGSACRRLLLRLRRKSLRRKTTTPCSRLKR